MRTQRFNERLRGRISEEFKNEKGKLVRIWERRHAHMTLAPGQHHLHFRKRILNNKEKFPSQKKKIRVLDSLVYLVSILGPAMAIPQVLKVFLLKNAGGISFITHLAWLIFSVIWIF